MIPLVVLISIAAVPLLLALRWRSNGAVAFMGVALGVMLAGMVRGDVVDFIAGFTSFGRYATPQWVGLGLIALPPLIGLIVTRKSVRISRQVLNFFPALAASLLLALFIVPLLPTSSYKQIASLELWHKLTELQTLILLVGAALSFVMFMFLRPPKKDEAKTNK